MDKITLGQIAMAVSFLVALIGGIGYLHNQLKKWVSDSLKEQFELMDKKIDALGEKVDAVDMNATKNFLVARLADIENDGLDEIELERFYEQYGHYHKLGGNSYIDQKVNKLKSAGKL